MDHSSISPFPCSILTTVLSVACRCKVFVPTRRRVSDIKLVSSTIPTPAVLSPAVIIIVVFRLPGAYLTTHLSKVGTKKRSNELIHPVASESAPVLHCASTKRNIISMHHFALHPCLLHGTSSSPQAVFRRNRFRCTGASLHPCFNETVFNALFFTTTRTVLHYSLILMHQFSLHQNFTALAFQCTSRSLHRYLFHCTIFHFNNISLQHFNAPASTSSAPLPAISPQRYLI